jgi:DNA-binding transcriptional regulator LsrR (DeoR family)
MADNGFDELTIRATWLYHRRGWTQEQIARKFRVSRATVARVLQRALQDGLVQIHFAPEPERLMVLEEAVAECYGLVEAILVPETGDPAVRQAALARATAAYLERSLEDGMVVALGTSRTLHDMATMFSPPQKLPGCTFVEMVGGIEDKDPRFDTYNVSWKLAETCGGTARHLFTPAVLSSVQARDMMLSDTRTSEILAMARHSDMSLLAIGDPSINCPVFRMAHLDETHIQALQTQGAVGEILGRPYRIDGSSVTSPIEDRVLGLTLEQIRCMSLVVAVAGGPERQLAILGALRQHFIKVLVTDAETGRLLCATPD